HQMAEEPVEGREAIREMFVAAFATATMVCVVENLFEDGEWAILEWRDPNGLRGCGFFHVVDGKIAFQRGYWDKLSFLRLQGLPLPTTSGARADGASLRTGSRRVVRRCLERARAHPHPCRNSPPVGQPPLHEDRCVRGDPAG